MFKKSLPICLVIASAFALFACSKDEAPANLRSVKLAKSMESVENASDSAISGIYFRYTYKGYTELYTHPADSIGFMHYYSQIYFLWTRHRNGSTTKHKSVSEFNFGSTWPTGTGTYNNAIFWIGDDTSYITNNMEFTIKRNAVNFGDTVEITFKGLVTEEDAIGTPDTTTVTGDCRVVLVNRSF